MPISSVFQVVAALQRALVTKILLSNALRIILHINFDKNCNSFLTKETSAICERIVNNIHSITSVLRIILETKKQES